MADKELDDGDIIAKLRRIFVAATRHTARPFRLQLRSPRGRKNLRVEDAAAAAAAAAAREPDLDDPLPRAPRLPQEQPRSLLAEFSYVHDYVQMLMRDATAQGVLLLTSPDFHEFAGALELRRSGRWEGAKLGCASAREFRALVASVGRVRCVKASALWRDEGDDDITDALLEWKSCAAPTQEEGGVGGSRSSDSTLEQLRAELHSGLPLLNEVFDLVFDLDVENEGAARREDDVKATKRRLRQKEEAEAARKIAVQLKRKKARELLKQQKQQKQKKQKKQIAAEEAVGVELEMAAEQRSARPRSLRFSLGAVVFATVAWVCCFGAKLAGGESIDFRAMGSSTCGSSNWMTSSVVLPTGTMLTFGGSSDVTSYAANAWGGTCEKDVFREFGLAVKSDVTGTTGTNTLWEPRAASRAVVMRGSSTIALSGGVGSSGDFEDVWISIDKAMTWVRRTAAAWGGVARHGHGLLATSTTSLFAFAGMHTVASPVYLNDLWRSDSKSAATIGADWVNIVSPVCSSPNHLKFDERAFFGSAYLPTMKRIVINGGKDGTVSFKSDLWVSDDGGNCWRELPSQTKWALAGSPSGRSGHKLFVITRDGIDSLMMMGGRGIKIASETNLNDLYRSKDGGATWVKITTTTNWVGADRFAAMYNPYHNTIVVCGGRKADTLFSSGCEVTTTEVTPPTWSTKGTDGDAACKLWGQASVALPSKIMTFGGADVYSNWEPSGKNTVCQSTDGGLTFTLLSASSDTEIATMFTPRTAARAVVVPAPSPMIVLTAGAKKQTGHLGLDDVWTSTDGVTWSLSSADAWGSEGRAAHGFVFIAPSTLVVFGGTTQTVNTAYQDTVWTAETTDTTVGTWSKLQCDDAGAGFTAHAWFAYGYLESIQAILAVGGVYNPSTATKSNLVQTSYDGGKCWHILAAQGHSQFDARNSLSKLVVYHTSNGDESALLIGGKQESDPNFMNEVLRSTDGGSTWTLLPPTGTIWAGRDNMLALKVPDQNSLVIEGGRQGTTIVNDPWQMALPMSNPLAWSKEGMLPGVSYLGRGVALPDGSLFVLGGATQYIGDWPPHASNTVYKSKDGGRTFVEFDTSQETDATWSARGCHAVVVLLGTNTIVVAGGINSANGRLNDVWTSLDAFTWTKMGDETNGRWSVRYLFGLVSTTAADLLVFGGSTSSATVYLNDVWSSSDKGATWTEVVTSGCGTGATDKWPERRSMVHAYLPTLDRVIVVGGIATTLLKDVWVSDGGVSAVGTCWVQLSDAPWDGSDNMVSTVIKKSDGSDLLIVYGGRTDNVDPQVTNNNVWRTDDGGYTWTRVLASTPLWEARQYAIAFYDVMRARVVITAGIPSGTAGITPFQDVWSASVVDLGADASGDVVSAWTRSELPAKRSQHATVVYPDGEILVLGGLSAEPSTAVGANAVLRSVGGAAALAVDAARSASFENVVGERYGHRVALLRGTSIAILAGGKNGAAAFQNDVYCSADHGVTWKSCSATSWEARADFGFVSITASEVVVFGGMKGDVIDASTVLFDTWLGSFTGTEIEWTESARNTDSSMACLDWAWNTAPLKFGAVYMPIRKELIVVGTSSSAAGVLKTWFSGVKGSCWKEKAELSDPSLPATTSKIELVVITLGGAEVLVLFATSSVWRSSDGGAIWRPIVEWGAHSFMWPARGRTSASVVVDSASLHLLVIGGSAMGSTGASKALIEMWRISYAALPHPPSTLGWSQNAHMPNAWQKRRFVSGVALPDGTLLSLGGNQKTTSSSCSPYNDCGMNDVHVSTNGGVTFALQSAPVTPMWSQRSTHANTVMLGTSIIAVVGGIARSSTAILSDVWISFDKGVNWAQHGNLPVAKRSFGLVSTSATTLLALGGYTDVSVGGSLYSNTVFKSTAVSPADIGREWKQLTCVGERWGIRMDFGTAYMPKRDRVLVAGGSMSSAPTVNEYPDVWGSDDGGECWERLTSIASPPWSSRRAPVLQVIEIDGVEILLLFGGLGVSNVLYNDVYRSIDGGATWKEVYQASDSDSADGIWPARFIFGGLVDVTSQKVIVWGGEATVNGASSKDVWSAGFSCATFFKACVIHAWSFNSIITSTPTTNIADSVHSTPAKIQASATPTGAGVVMGTSVGSHIEIDFGNEVLGGPMTIEVLAKWDTFSENSRLFDCGAGKVSNIVLYNVGTTGEIAWQVYRGATNSREVRGTGADVVIGKRHHIIATVKGSRMRLYIDGVLVKESIAGWEPQSVLRTSCYIGKSNRADESGNLAFQGTISLFKIYSGAMDQDEVNAAFASKFPFLEHAWDFRGTAAGAGLKVVDSIGLIDGELVGGASRSATGVALDGTDGYIKLAFPVTERFGGELTFEAVVKFEEFESTALRLFGFGASPVVSSIIAKVYNNLGRLGVIAFDGTASIMSDPAGTARTNFRVTGGVRFHIVITFSSLVTGGGTIAIYINGKVDAIAGGATTALPPHVTRANCFIGTDAATSATKLKGEVSMFRIYSGAVDAKKASALYRENFPFLEHEWSFGLAASVVTVQDVVGGAAPTLSGTVTRTANGIALGDSASAYVSLFGGVTRSWNLLAGNEGFYEGDMTVTVVFVPKSSSSTGSSTLLSCGTRFTDGYFALTLSTGVDPKLTPMVYTTEELALPDNDQPQLKLGTRYVVSASIEKTKVVVYMNGYLAATLTGLSKTPYSIARDNCSAGADSPGDLNFVGELASVKLYAGAMDAERAAAEYKAIFPMLEYFYDFRKVFIGPDFTESNGGTARATPTGYSDAAAVETARSATGITLDGSDDYLQTSSLTFGGSLTFEIVVRFNVLSTTDDTVLFFCGNDGSADGFVLSVKSTTARLKIEAKYQSQSALVEGNDGNGNPIAINTRYHIVAVIESTSLVLYTNGMRVAPLDITRSTVTPSSNAITCTLGRDSIGATASTAHASVEISYFKIHSGAMNDVEVAALYNGEFPMLEHAWDFDTGAHADTVGDAATSLVGSPGYSGTAGIVLTGSGQYVNLGSIRGIAGSVSIQITTAWTTFVDGALLFYCSDAALPAGATASGPNNRISITTTGSASPSRLRFDCGGEAMETPSPIVFTDIEYQITLSIEAKMMKAYVNGELAVERMISTSVASTGRDACFLGNGAPTMTGSIAAAKIYTGALTAAEASYVAPTQAPTSAPTTPLYTVVDARCYAESDPGASTLTPVSACRVEGGQVLSVIGNGFDQVISITVAVDGAACTNPTVHYAAADGDYFGHEEIRCIAPCLRSFNTNLDVVVQGTCEVSSAGSCGGTGSVKTFVTSHAFRGDALVQVEASSAYENVASMDYVCKDVPTITHVACVTPANCEPKNGDVNHLVVPPNEPIIITGTNFGVSDSRPTSSDVSQLELSFGAATGCTLLTSQLAKDTWSATSFQTAMCAPGGSSLKLSIAIGTKMSDGGTAGAIHITVKIAENVPANLNIGDFVLNADGETFNSTITWGVPALLAGRVGYVLQYTTAGWGVAIAINRETFAEDAVAKSFTITNVELGQVLRVKVGMAYTTDPETPDAADPSTWKPDEYTSNLNLRCAFAPTKPEIKALTFIGLTHQQNMSVDMLLRFETISFRGSLPTIGTIGYGPPPFLSTTRLGGPDIKIDGRLMQLGVISDFPIDITTDVVITLRSEYEKGLDGTKAEFESNMSVAMYLRVQHPLQVANITADYSTAESKATAYTVQLNWINGDESETLPGNAPVIGHTVHWRTASTSNCFNSSARAAGDEAITCESTAVQLVEYTSHVQFLTAATTVLVPDVPFGQVTCFAVQATNAVGTSSLSRTETCIDVAALLRSKCEKGTHLANDNAFDCVKCEIGRFAAESGKSACDDCAGGAYTAAEGLTACAECGVGLFLAHTSNVSCTKCANGRYSNTASQTSCSSCVAKKPGTFTVNEGSSTCTECAEGKYAPSNATVVEASSSCEECPESRLLACSAGLVMWEKTAWYDDGEWVGSGNSQEWVSRNSPVNKKTEVHECFNDISCVLSDDKSTVSCLTEQGYYGPLCGGCDKGRKFIRNGYVCTECYDPHLNWLVAVGLCCGILVVVAYIGAFRNTSQKVGDFGGIIRRIAFSYMQVGHFIVSSASNIVAH